MWNQAEDRDPVPDSKSKEFVGVIVHQMRGIVPNDWWDRFVEFTNSDIRKSIQFVGSETDRIMLLQEFQEKHGVRFP